MATLFVATIAGLKGQPGLPRSRIHLPVSINGDVSATALYDAGAAVSTIHEKIFRKIPLAQRPKKVDAPIVLSCENGSPIEVRDCYFFEMKILDRVVTHAFHVVNGTHNDVILGMDFIEDQGLSLEACSKTLYFSQSNWKEEEEASLLSATHVTIPPQSTKCIKVKAFLSPEEPICGPFSVISSIDCTRIPLLGNDGLCTIDKNGFSYVMVDNPSDVEVDLERGTYIGSIEQTHVSKLKPVEFDMSSKPLASGPPSEAASREKRELLTEALKSQIKELDPSTQKLYVDLILLNHDVFSNDKYDIGKTHVMEHNVRLSDSAPVYRKQFRIPEAHRSVLIDYLNKWVDLGVVRPSKSTYNSPIFCVPKKDGSLRPVLDFRAINDISFVDKYSQREVADCLDELGRSQSKVFSSLDLTSGFWQLPLAEEARKVTAFTIPGLGSWEWCVTPMGLLGSPASFGRMMDFVFRQLSAICYQDDVLCHSKDHVTQIEQLQLCFNRLRAHGLKLNVKKCHFGQSEVPYLGHTLTSEGILPGKDKTEAIRDFKPPSTIRQVREFVGLCNYFRASVPNFSKHSGQLTKLMKKDSGWSGGDLPPESLEAFETLKSRLLSPPVLAYPDPRREYHLVVDASLGSEGIPGGLGAALIQYDDEDIPHPVGFASRGLDKHERNYSAYLLELAAACFGISYFDVYLRGVKFSLYTDHRPLEKLGKVHTRTLNRLQQLMLEYNFTIHYKPGKDNTVSDFLSRNPIVSSLATENLADAQTKDPIIVDLVSKIRSNSQDPKFLKIAPFLMVEDGILFHISESGRKQLFIPESLRQQVLISAHNSLLGGHMGIFKTKERILANYFWPGMDRDVKTHVAACVDCQRTKPYRVHPRAPLQPLPQPSAPNHRVHIDLFGPLATSESGKKYIMVMTDAFSKYVELASLRSKEAEEVARALYDTWITRYSTPTCIVSDNGREFCNKLMKSLCDHLKIMHKTTSPYHPECNASAEVFNRTMRHYIQAVIQPPYLDWEIYLPALRISYNTSVSKATKFTPFEIVFGMEANMPFFDFPPSFSYDLDYDARLVALEKARREAEENNIIYKRMYESQYNARHNVRAESGLVVGDQILVATQPSVKYKNNKLHPTFEGPFPVVKIRIPNVYYRKGSKVHVSHVNRVKKASVVKTFFETDLSADHREDRVQSISPVPAPVRSASRADSSSDDEIVVSRPNLRSNSPDESALDSQLFPADKSVWPPSPPRNSDIPQNLNNETGAFMDTDERSHIFHDVTMADPESDTRSVSSRSQSRSLGARVKSLFSPSKLVRSSSKRSLESPDKPGSKLTRSASPETDRVSLSLADMCLSPPAVLADAANKSENVFARATRSKGPVNDVPKINFPVESKAYQRRLAAGPAGTTIPAHPAGTTIPAHPVDPSTVPAGLGGEGQDANNVAVPSPGAGSV